MAQVKEPGSAAERTSTPLDVAAIEDALARVLDSGTFRRSPRSRDVLTYVVAETLAGRGQVIKERTIARQALGRGHDVDTRTDPSGRVQVARVRELLARYYEQEASDDPVRIAIPLGQYAAVFNPNAARPSIEPNIGEAGRTAGPLLAVVRLAAAGSNTQDRRAAVGLTETLVQNLTRFPGLRVMGPLAGESRAGPPDVAAIAARTGADFVLHGTVRDRDDLLRVVVHLVDAGTGELRWSETFDRRSHEFTGFGAEDDIVAHVVGQIADYRGVILRAPAANGRPTGDAQARDALAAYYAFIDELDPAAAIPTVLALEEAVGSEPDNPLLLASLAGMYGIDVLMRGAVEAADSLQRAEELGRAALRVDPHSAQAHSVLGVVTLARGRLDEARAHARAILQLTPHHPTHTYTAGMIIEASGAWEEGIEVIRRAVAVNPHHPTHERTLLAIDDLERDDVASALDQARQLHFPGYVYGPLLRAVCYAELGDEQATREEVAELLAVCPDFFDRPAQVLGAAPTMPDHAVEHLVGRLAQVERLLGAAPG